MVVHGGGPQIGELMARLGKVPEFRDGLRVTDAETLEIARMVLVGKVNREIVSAINVHGPLAVGLSGEDANLITAIARAEPARLRGRRRGGRPLDHRSACWPRGSSRWWPPSRPTPTGQAYNINADAVAGAIAAALHAEKLVFLTDVAGLRADPDDPELACCARSRSTSSTPWWRRGRRRRG